MSKKLNKSLSSQSNTLFNYFSSPKGSPKTPNTPKRAVQEKSINSTPATSSKDKNVQEIITPTPSKVPRNVMESSDDDSDQENRGGQKAAPVRKRIRYISDSSDSDNESRKKVKADNVSAVSNSVSYDEGSSLRAMQDFVFKKRDTNASKNSIDIASNAKQKSKLKTVTPAATPRVETDSVQWRHEGYDFLKPDYVMDAKRRRPDDPDYDRHTLLLPAGFLDKQTPGMRQWWVLKSGHFDCVLCFKVGKFYELYHMDAITGVQALGLTFMKGEFAHSGFPEIAFEKMASGLIERGFRVARVEQTETPEMLKERSASQSGTKKDKVVRRELCQVTERATYVMGPQMQHVNEAASYLLAVQESALRVGVAFVDTTAAVFYMAEFDDDKYYSRVCTMLAQYPPRTLLISSDIADDIETLLKKRCSFDVRIEKLRKSVEFYNAEKTIQMLKRGQYFTSEKGQSVWPTFLEKVANDTTWNLSVSALGACLWYMQNSQIDIQIFSMGKFIPYVPFDRSSAQDMGERDALIIDAPSIENLNLLGEVCTLQKSLDHCCTAFGKRLLQHWICNPLANVAKIEQRQAAVVELAENPKILAELRVIMSKLPDFERLLAKINTFGNSRYQKQHPDSRALFYESKTYTKRKILDLIAALSGFDRSMQIPEICSGMNARLIRKLTQFIPTGEFADARPTIIFFQKAFDHKIAKETGTILPKPDTDEDYDNAVQRVKAVQLNVDAYLLEQQRIFGSQVCYFGTDKKRYQLEIPDSYSALVPHDYLLEGIKKGKNSAKRYTTAETKELLSRMQKAERERTEVIDDMNRRIFAKFSAHYDTWEPVMQCVMVLDVLCSFAEFARTYSYSICMPQVLPFSDKPVLDIAEGRHPCMPHRGDYVPNPMQLGNEFDASLLILTGPNMGGKSSLMRQTALIIIMAQMGCYVPAAMCRLSLVDRVFTRIGARDDLIRGQSTFLTEMIESSLILQHASVHSFLMLDELGRGTSTHDGNAIANAYIDELMASTRCRAIFATHYHNLVNRFANTGGVRLGHMACVVEGEADKETVTFLYTLDAGACPKSYGFNVARLAGLDVDIIARGRKAAAEMELAANMHEAVRMLFTSETADEKRELLRRLARVCL